MQPRVPLTMAANRKPCPDPLDDNCTRKFGKTDGQGSWFFQSLLEEPAPELPWKGAGLQATPHRPPRSLTHCHHHGQPQPGFWARILPAVKG